MKVIIVALAIMAVVASAPVDVEPVKILRSEFTQTPEGSYVYSYETENGINRVENGEVKEAFDEENKPHPVVVVRGSFSYINTEGKPETITYYADETGYHPEGDSIPKPVSK